MKLQTTFWGSDQPFEGDLTLDLRGLPVDAQIVRSTARVIPLPSSETVALGASPPYLWGVTRAGSTVDFHARRVVSQVKVPSATIGTVHVQIDIGGVWVTLNNDGTLAVPDDGKSREFAVASGVVNTLEVITSRLQVTQGTSLLQIEEVAWRSLPTNASLRIGAQGPFWFQAGELHTAATTADFTEPLRAYLRGATAENGHAVVPFTMHSDAIARLEVVLEIDYLRQQDLLPAGVNEVILPFAYGLLPEADPHLLGVALPPNARVVPGMSLARAVGTFEPTRIVFGPTTPVSSTAVVRITPDCSQAQPFRVPTDLTATALDLRLEPLTRPAILSVTLLADADGKPFGESLLPRPVTIRLDQEVGAGPSWVSAPLPVEFQFKTRGPDSRSRCYWLVVNGAEGEVSWDVRPQTDNPVGLHCSQDDGLSWQPTEVRWMPGPLAGLFRLRHTPSQFKVPIQLQIGQGDKAQRLALDHFQPLGRVDFALDSIEVADSFNQHLLDTAPIPCPVGEHLVNGDFERWIEVSQSGQVFHPEEWDLTSGQVEPYEGSTSTLPFGETPNTGAVIVGTESQPGALSQVIPVVSSCQYQFEFVGLASAEGAVAEVIWLGGNCDVVRIDRLPFVVLQVESARLELHRVRLQSPAEATQVEVRFVVPAGTSALVQRASLAATADVIANGDLGVVQQDRPANWMVTPEEATPGQFVQILPGTAGIAIENTGNRPVSLVQRNASRAGQLYTLEFQGRAVKQREQSITQVELHWLKADGSSVGADTVQPMVLPGFDRYIVEGVVPDEATHVEVRLVVPASATLEVGHISLHMVESTPVPITFLAQTAGELAVFQGHVTYDLIELSPPTLPSIGLCRPIPLGQKPGIRPENRCFCPGCGTERPLMDTTPAVTPAGRPAVIGYCSVCGTRLVRHGGQLIDGAPPIPHQLLLARPHIFPPPISPVLPSTTPPPSTAEVASIPPLIAISGIGEARARRLAEIGIDSIQNLAAAMPQEVARVLRGVSVEMANRFIGDATRLLSSGEAP